ncbi:restriction endonuclease subunit S [Lactobacillus delbrueckii]|uniref:restriction endonuclease subunit S n=1 Tax=Lactobacillus delbrueckii TaxID=1584 RepID=UPI003A8A23F5
MKDEKKVPKLRFKGFADDWEQCKLGDVADRFDNLRVPITANLRKNGDTPYYGANGIQDYVDGYTHDGEYILVAEDGANNLKNYPINYVSGRIWVNNHAHVLQAIPYLASTRFLGYEIGRSNIVSLLVGGGRAKLNADALMNMNLNLPKIKEQELIADLFQKVEISITLHEEKKHQLESLKSALLQKMFANKNGYPTVRFEGFSNEWEHCKLGDVADITTGSRNHQDSVTDGKYPFFVRSDKVERLNEYDFDTKAILVPGDGRIGEIFHYYNGKFALHQRVYKVDNFNGINELFLLGLFKYSFKEHALRLNAQGTVPSLRLPMFTNWSISVPMITEQERIGVFFQKLEQTISLYDHKLELLKK